MKRDIGPSSNHLLPEEIENSVHIVFTKKKEICVESFEEGALLLNISTRELVEINPQEYWIWQHIDGKKSLDQIAEDYSKKFQIKKEKSQKIVDLVCRCFWMEKKLIDLRKNKKGVIMDNKKYIQNPDVNLREEDEDGALLFNPDTDRVQLLSQTGHYIWKKCENARTVEDIVNGFKKDFDKVPLDQVQNDVVEFLNQMVESGFIGILNETRE